MNGCFSPILPVRGVLVSCRLTGLSLVGSVAFRPETSRGPSSWERYFRRLVGLAHKKLQDTPRRVADEEDVALSAFHSFCRAAEQGRFPHLADRHDLWQLLMTITSRKACHLLRDQHRLKRGGGVEADPRRAGEAIPTVEEVAGDEPTPDLAAQVAEEYRRLLGLLGSKELETVALHKMEGYSNEEIAGLRGCTTRTVERQAAADPRHLGTGDGHVKPVPDRPPLEAARWLDQACDQFELGWKQSSASGRRPRIEDFLAGAPSRPAAT